MIQHTPVLTKEVLKFLAPHSNKNYIDATCGFGGHAVKILEKTKPSGKLLAIDQDEEALEEAQKNLKNFLSRIDFCRANFAELGLIVRSWKVSRIDGILFDLGVSTYQLLSPERGFSFNASVELDMRMSRDTKLTARKIVNSWSENELHRLFKNYGEEPFARQIAREIVKARIRPISKTDELVRIIKKAMPPKYRHSREKHFATATFRALRMATNNELENLRNGLKQARQVLSPTGHLVVISFHSLEDRIVKSFFLEGGFEVLTKKPIKASPDEIRRNPKARSAKLRAAIKKEIG